MTWLLLAVQLALSAVLVVACTGKILQSEQFAAALRLSHIPAGLAESFRIAIPVLECCLALALLVSVPRSLQVALAVAAGLFAIFTSWLVWVVARRMHLHCGCFGASGAEVSSLSIARNVALLLAAVGGAILAGWTESPLPAPSLWTVVTVSSCAMGVALLVSLRAGFPSLVLSMERVLVLSGGTSVEGEH
mgnify:CR=1 FL=1